MLPWPIKGHAHVNYALLAHHNGSVWEQGYGVAGDRLAQRQPGIFQVPPIVLLFLNCESSKCKTSTKESTNDVRT